MLFLVFLGIGLVFYSCSTSTVMCPDGKKRIIQNCGKFEEFMEDDINKIKAQIHGPGITLGIDFERNAEKVSESVKVLMLKYKLICDSCNSCRITEEEYNNYLKQIMSLYGELIDISSNVAKINNLIENEKKYFDLNQSSFPPPKGNLTFKLSEDIWSKIEELDKKIEELDKKIKTLAVSPKK